MYPFETKPSYGMRVIMKCADIVQDAIEKNDPALYEFGNAVMRLAKKRGLPYEEPIPVFDASKLTVKDFENA